MKQILHLVIKILVRIFYIFFQIIDVSANIPPGTNLLKTKHIIIFSFFICLHDFMKLEMDYFVSLTITLCNSIIIIQKQMRLFQGYN